MGIDAYSISNPSGGGILEDKKLDSVMNKNLSLEESCRRRTAYLEELRNDSLQSFMEALVHLGKEDVYYSDDEFWENPATSTYHPSST